MGSFQCDNLALAECSSLFNDMLGDAVIAFSDWDHAHHQSNFSDSIKTVENIDACLDYEVARLSASTAPWQWTENSVESCDSSTMSSCFGQLAPVNSDYVSQTSVMTPDADSKLESPLAEPLVHLSRSNFESLDGDEIPFYELYDIELERPRNMLSGDDTGVDCRVPSAGCRVQKVPHAPTSHTRHSHGAATRDNTRGFQPVQEGARELPRWHAHCPSMLPSIAESPERRPGLRVRPDARQAAIVPGSFSPSTDDTDSTPPRLRRSIALRPSREPPLRAVMRSPSGKRYRRKRACEMDADELYRIREANRLTARRQRAKFKAEEEAVKIRLHELQDEQDNLETLRQTYRQQLTQLVRAALQRSQHAAANDVKAQALRKMMSQCNSHPIVVKAKAAPGVLSVSRGRRRE